MVDHTKDSASTRAPPRVLLKIIVLGASGSGKTSITKRWVHGDFSEYRQATIGADFYTKEIELDSQSVLLQIWDTAGQERFVKGVESALGTAFYRGASGALLVTRLPSDDVTSQRSFDQVPVWHDEVLERLKRQDCHVSFPMVVVGNKSDMLGSVPQDGITGVDMESVKDWCRSVGCDHVDTSAKSNSGVSDTISTIGMLALQEHGRNSQTQPCTKNPGEYSLRASRSGHSGLLAGRPTEDHGCCQ